MKRLINIIIIVSLFSGAFGQTSIESARNATVGSQVTVTGVVTNGDELGAVRYIQDEAAGIAVYSGSGSVELKASPGDIITVTGKTKKFYGLLEVDNLTAVEVNSSGNPIPDPVQITPDQMGVEYESQLVEFNNVVFTKSGTFAGDNNYTVSIGGKSGDVRIYRDSPIVGKVIPTGPVNLTGIVSRFNSTYQLLPRTMDDIQQTSPIYFEKVPELSNLSTEGFTLDWETNISGSTEILYGNTPELEKGKLSVPGDSTIHTISITGASASELFYIKAFSVSGNDTALLDPRVYITQSVSSGDIKVYFNREVNNSVSTGVNALRVYRALDDTLINYINRAEETIDFTIYNYNLDKVSDITAALNAAHARGVRVRVIHDGDANNFGFANLDPEIGKLVSPPSDYYKNIGIMHNKFIVFDAYSSDPNIPVVWTGSTNFTDGQVNVDPNSVIILQDQSLAKAYTIEFNEMYGTDQAQPDEIKSLFGASKKDNTPHEFIIGGRQVRAYFSPSDNVHALIKETIMMAEADISVATMLITKSDIGYALRDQQEAGRMVRVLVNSKANCSEYVVSTLESALGDKFLETGESGIIMHHKYMLVDRTGSDPVLWVGCHNWSTAADTRNDENTLIIRDATLVNIYYQEFYERFEKSGGSVGLSSYHLDGSTWKVYPNPAQDIIRLQYDGPQTTDAVCEIYNLSGKMMLSRHLNIQPGTNSLQLNADIKEGVYLLRIRWAERQEVIKLLVN